MTLDLTLGVLSNSLYDKIHVAIVMCHGCVQYVKPEILLREQVMRKGCILGDFLVNTELIQVVSILMNLTKLDFLSMGDYYCGVRK